MGDKSQENGRPASVTGCGMMCRLLRALAMRAAPSGTLEIDGEEMRAAERWRISAEKLPGGGLRVQVRRPDLI